MTASLLAPPTFTYHQPHFQVPVAVPAKKPVEVALPSKDQKVAGAQQPPGPGSAGSPPPSTALSHSVVPPPAAAAAGQNGNVRNGTPQRMSMGGDGETISPYINGGIINKRFSYSGSLVSESLDLSPHRESLSVSSRVSLSAAGCSSWPYFLTYVEPVSCLVPVSCVAPVSCLVPGLRLVSGCVCISY